MNEFDAFLKTMGPLKEFQQHVFVDVENKAIELWLEDTPHYGDWIKGEGADIALYRSLDDDRVVGVRLPLREWNGNLPVEIING